MRLILPALGILWILAACQSDRTIDAYETEKKTVAPVTQTDVQDDHLHLTWEEPEGWNPGRESSMRIGSFAIPTEWGDADCSIIVLKGEAGGLHANINRWRGQTGLPQASPEEIDGDLGKLKSKLGVFDTYRVINPDNTEMAFLTATLPYKGQTVFVKLAAHAEAISALELDFHQFCLSMQDAGHNHD